MNEVFGLIWLHLRYVWSSWDSERNYDSIDTHRTSDVDRKPVNKSDCN